jgi:1-acyl-sn-glycerol-3-phosphate acyltransferase
LVGRLVGLLGVLRGVLVSAPVGLLLPVPERSTWWQPVTRMTLAVMGIRVQVRGPRRFGDGVLVVANHLSWVEVLALATVQPVRVLAEQEIRGWFLLGSLVAALGCLFVDRRGLHRLPETVGRLTAIRRAGQAVVALRDDGLRARLGEVARTSVLRRTWSQVA